MEKIIDYINGELSVQETKEFEKRLAEDSAFRIEFEKEMAVWNLLGEIQAPEPDTSLPKNFLSTLDLYREAASGVTFFEKLKQLWSFQPQLKLSYAMLLLVIGLSAGYFLQTKDTAHSEVASLSSEVSELKQMMLLSLIDNPSAAERIRAVSFTQEIQEVNDPVIEALFSTLNKDPNDNVRLMTLEALMTLADSPKVREGLVKSIVLQTSPLMQTAMADAMVRLQEKRSLAPFRKMLDQPDLNSTVKNKIEKSIDKIII